MLIDEAALATMFGEPSLRPATGVYGSRLFLFVNAADMLTSPDRVHFQGDEFPGADTCAVLALREQRYQYLGAGHRRDEEKCWEIPEVDFETWRRWGHGRTASRRLPPEKMAQASELVARVLGLPAEERKFERLGGGQGLVLGGASQGGLRIGAPDGEFRERTVSLNDIAWVLVAAEDVEHTGGSLDEARVNRLRYLKGTPKSSTRYIDTGWAIGVWRRWKK
jgi:hypothetical protein